MAFIFQSPLTFLQSTGLTIDPNNTELFGKQRKTITFSIGQDVATTSDVLFNQITVSDEKFIIDNEDLFLKSGEISGSLTVSSNTTIAQNLTGNQDLTVLGTLTAEKIETEVTQSVTLFESGSTIFGDTSDDTHQFSGSICISGSLSLNDYSVHSISNDTTLADSSTTALVTENAVKTYIDNQTDDQQSYLRKQYVKSSSSITVPSTASFSAVTASAPTGMTSTTENDFLFFINGQYMEHDALTITQSGSVFLLKVDNDSIGYDLELDDEVLVWGKFNS